MRRMDDFCSVFQRRADAVALVNGSEKYINIHGNVLFYQMRDGVIVRAEIMGLPRGKRPCEKPIFGFHIHSGGTCSGTRIDPFANAHGHYNPNDCLHPYHAGDMPPLFGANGRAFLAFLSDRFTVREILGKTVMIHAMPDDFKTQPAGGAGEKIACGIITRAM